MLTLRIIRPTGYGVIERYYDAAVNLSDKKHQWNAGAKEFPNT